MKENLVSIIIDEEAIKNIIKENIQDKLSTVDTTKVFYTMADLEEITGFSKTHIMNTFFDDERFINIRHKVGRKWVFQAEETRAFLKEWIKEMPNE